MVDGVNVVSIMEQCCFDRGCIVVKTFHMDQVLSKCGLVHVSHAITECTVIYRLY